jgi:hypothetical protein
MQRGGHNDADKIVLHLRCNLRALRGPQIQRTLNCVLIMASLLAVALLFLLSFLHGCSHNGPGAVPTEQRRSGPPPEVLAVYEAWFGHPSHLSIGYSSHDPDLLRKQMRDAKKVGISGFVVDWYGYRQPFIDRSYALMQSIAAEENFHVAMMYDETDEEDGATDEALEDFKLFHKVYLGAAAPGRNSYLTFEGRPVIFIFPKGRHTDWSRIRAEVNKWEKPPILISEYPPDGFAAAIDGYYAWVNPGPKGWAPDGSNWGEPYLTEFYKTMASQHPDKIAVGGAWPGFDDSKAAWGLNRHISARCGQTMADTLNLWRQHSANYYMPYLLIATWDDYEEGTAIERGVPGCGSTAPLSLSR